MELLSDAVPGSGEGLSGIIDIDVANDEYGILYIPAKRIKGVLRESALELNETGVLHNRVDDIFGASGQQEGAVFKISDGYIENYLIYKEFLEYTTAHKDELAPLFNREIVLDGFTYQRSRTTIDNETGTAKENTLRTSRVLKRGLKFYFWVEFPPDPGVDYHVDLEKICKVTRRFGLSRTRGMGEIRMTCHNIHDKSFLGGQPHGMGDLRRPFGPSGESLICDSQLPSSSSSFYNDLLVAEGKKPGQHYKLILSIKNQGQLMVTSKTGKKQASETYMPGSALLGIFANSYIKYHSLEKPHHDPVFRELFLEGKVAFSNAYPGKKSFDFKPTPLSLHKEKDMDNYFDLSNERDFHNVLDDEISLKALKDEFVQVNDNGYLTPYSVEACVEYHHSRPEDKGIGHAGEGNGVFFQYAVLKAEENFRAEIEGPFDLLEKIIELCQRQDIFYMGKSKTAQYGKCSIQLQDIEEKETPVGQWQDKESMVVTLESDMVLRNRNGFVTPEPRLLIDEIAGILGISPGMLQMERQFLAFTTKSGFSGVWRLPRIQENAIKAGSVIVIKNNSGQSLDLGKISGQYFGIDTREGCGKIKISRCKRKNLTYEMYKPDPPPLPFAENLEKIQETIKGILLLHIRLQLKTTALQKAQQSQLPSNSFIGKIGMFVQQAKTFKDLNEYFSQLRERGKKQLEKIERPLFIEGIEKKQVEIDKVKKFILDNRKKSGVDAEKIRDILRTARIDEHFFTGEETAFDLYKYYAGLFLSTLRLVSRRKDEE